MYEHLQVVALICCRGGSKGIPGKNIKAFAGRPLLSWVLDAARRAEAFDSIVLSTDSPEIAEVGRAGGALVPGLRPAHLAGDTSDQFDTHRHVFAQLGITDDTHRVCILNNNPFVDEALIRAGYQAAAGTRFARVVLDSIRLGGDYVHYRHCFEHEGILRFQFPRVMLESAINRQGIAPSFTSINNTRWARPSVLTSYEAYKRDVVLNGFVPVWLPKSRSFDLDDLEDWKIAEAVFAMLRT